MNEHGQVRQKDNKIPVIDFAAREKFRNLSAQLGYDPDDRWVGGYVNYEWQKIRHVVDILIPENNQKILEFGCHVGATAIVAALLGHNVDAVDIDGDIIKMARLNAEQYGVSDRINFKLIEAGQRLDFDDGFFDAIVCNSVLEYVDDEHVEAVLGELDRLLKPEGKLIISGTSSRLSPREVHRRQWLVNYLPEWLGKIIFGKNNYQRGLNPFRVMRVFKDYRNLDLEEGGKLYFEIKKRQGLSSGTINKLKLIKAVFHPLGLSVGLFTPSFSVNLKKQS